MASAILSLLALVAVLWVFYGAYLVISSIVGLFKKVAGVVEDS